MLFFFFFGYVIWQVFVLRCTLVNCFWRGWWLFFLGKYFFSGQFDVMMIYFGLHAGNIVFLYFVVNVYLSAYFLKNDVRCSHRFGFVFFMIVICWWLQLFYYLFRSFRYGISSGVISLVIRCVVCDFFVFVGFQIYKKCFFRFLFLYFFIDGFVLLSACICLYVFMYFVQRFFGMLLNFFFFVVFIVLFYCCLFASLLVSFCVCGMSFFLKYPVVFFFV